MESDSSSQCGFFPELMPSTDAHLPRLNAFRGMSFTPLHINRHASFFLLQDYPITCQQAPALGIPIVARTYMTT